MFESREAVLYEAFGSDVVQATADEHDSQIALIQVLVHESDGASARCSSDSRPDLWRSPLPRGPVDRAELSMIGRMFSPMRRLYAAILTKQPPWKHAFEMF